METKRGEETRREKRQMNEKRRTNTHYHLFSYTEKYLYNICTTHPHTHQNTLASQQIYTKINEKSNAQVVYPGLQRGGGGDGGGEEKEEGTSGAAGEKIWAPGDIPGLREAGWTPEMSQAAADGTTLESKLRSLCREVKRHSHAWPFAKVREEKKRRNETSREET